MFLNSVNRASNDPANLLTEHQEKPPALVSDKIVIFVPNQTIPPIYMLTVMSVLVLSVIMCLEAISWHMSLFGNEML